MSQHEGLMLLSGGQVLPEPLNTITRAAARMCSISYNLEVPRDNAQKSEQGQKAPEEEDQ